LDKNSQSLQQVSEKNMAQILTPLKERISEFQKKVEETYHSESRERFALKSEIEKIVKANEKMTFETQSLTRALKGDVKVQGNWGEMVLERILEASGLRAGEEYVTQGEGMKLKDEFGRDQRPDVIVRLPEGKHLIVDSKVSLVHYERILSESESAKVDEAKELFLASVKAHIDGLSKKRYQDLEGLGSPDFVMLFVPIEGAFSMAIQGDGALFSRAWDQGVIVVSPTTLLATLRTIASVWKQERQTRNALEIARVGGALYEKFAGFVDDLKLIDVKLGDAKDAYEKAMNKLSTGKGNLVSRVEHLKKLGAKTSKSVAIAQVTDFQTGEQAEQESLDFKDF
jgi:DNA recombination protein RmuC